MPIQNLSISAFLTNAVPKGGARPNRFRVVLTFPQGLTIPADVPRRMSFSCKATTAPGHTLGATPVPYMGRTAKLAGDEELDDWSVTIVVDNDFVSRDAIESWKQFIISTNTNIGKNAPLEYMGSADVEQLDREGNIIKTFGLEKIFPTIVGPMTLGWDNNNTVHEFETTFAINDLIYGKNNTTAA